MSAPNTILLDGDGFRREEAIGSGSIKPGMLLEYGTDGVVQAHSIEGGRGLCMVAIEDSLQGKTVDDAYTTGTLVQYAILQPGTRFMGLLEDNANVHEGDRLVSSGAGCFQEANAATSDADTDMMQRIMAEVLEDTDLTGSGVTDTLAPMRAY